MSTTTTAPARRILLIAANPATSPITGWPIGVWAAELTHPWLAFTEAGYAVTLASPAGGRVDIDAFSDPQHESGYSSHDLISRGFLSSPTHAALLTRTPALAALDPASFDAIFVCGGQAPMVTFPTDRALHDFLTRAWEAGKVLALVCHGTCLLLTLRDGTGRLLADDRTWTGFSNDEERAAEAAVGGKLQPFWIETEARRNPATRFVTHRAFEPFAVRDGRLITGQQQNSGRAAADLVIAALGR